MAVRAVAITLIVGTHAGLFGIAGGAHLLLAVAGFNLARFRLAAPDRGERARQIASSVGRVAVASMIFIGLVAVVTGEYSLANVFLVNYLVGSGAGHAWHFWFIESIVYIQIAAMALLAVPALDRWERRFPFGMPAALVVVGLVTRYELHPWDLATPVMVFWLFALGWAAAKAAGRWQRLWVSVAAVMTVPGLFGDLQREAVVVAGLLLVIWVSRVPSLRPLNRVAGPLAAGSLYIYLTHWQVYPRLTAVSVWLAVAGSLVVGIGYGMVATRVGARLSRIGRELAVRVAGRLRRAFSKVSLTSVSGIGDLRE